MNDVNKILPKFAQNIIDIFEQNDFSAYVVGGALRDLLLLKDVSDFDIATSATPSEVKKLFPKHFALGEKYGTITVAHEGRYFEVTTYRSDGEYSDCRHPESVSFGVDIYSDLARRDFTINAMAVGKNEFIDPFSGQLDLKNKIIRSVGEPRLRFGEDALRILRAYRFSAALGFSIEESTLLAMRECAPLVKNMSGERIKSEVIKILESDRPNIIKDMQVACTLDEFKQKREINFLNFSPSRRFLAFLFNLGDREGAVNSLALSKEEQRAFLPHGLTDRLKSEMDKTELKRLMRDFSEKAVELAICFLEGFCEIGEKPFQMLTEIRNGGEPYRREQLSISGEDLLLMGVQSGPEIGKILEVVLDRVIEEPEQNKTDLLLLMIPQIIKSS